MIELPKHEDLQMLAHFWMKESAPYSVVHYFCTDNDASYFAVEGRQYEHSMQSPIPSIIAMVDNNGRLHLRHDNRWKQRGSFHMHDSTSKRFVWKYSLKDYHDVVFDPQCGDDLLKAEITTVTHLLTTKAIELKEYDTHLGAFDPAWLLPE